MWGIPVEGRPRTPNRFECGGKLMNARTTVELLFDFGHHQWTGRLFLSDTVSEIVTLEDVLTPLNDDREFLPVATADPPFVWIVNKQALCRARWSFDSIIDLEKHTPWDRRERVRIELYPETSLSGYLVIVHQREGFSRVQDFLNMPYRFIPVIDQNQPWVWFINKRHILRIGHVHD
jgi:hypothetical protein